MRLTSKSEYALLALLFLARQKSGGFVTVKKISSRRGIPSKFLEQILLALKRVGYVQSCKGHRGGYRLAKRPQQITLAEIIRFLDGALAPTDSVSKYFYDSTPAEKERKLMGVFREIRDYIANRLERTTLADVL
jgi:Rrf2 family cysteine metabolism transcriptional repressor